MATVGAANGTDIFVSIENTPGSGTFTQIGGQSSHTITLNNSAIDITTKDSASFRELLDAKGLQSLDLTLELTFNSQAAYAQLRALAGTRVITLFRITIGGSNLDCKFMIGSWAETGADGEALTNSVSMISSGSFTWV